MHKALPETDRDRICLTTNVFGHDFAAPVFVGAMTGGTAKATSINACIAEAVEELGLGMGVGSQRAAIENPELDSTYRIVRKKAPTAFLAANIGAPQLVQGYGVQEAERAVEMIEADALAIHLNPLQEAIQPEGETKYVGVFRKIVELAKDVDIPIIVKETGAGISAEVAQRLEQAGADGIDVSGAGGTSWAAVEYYRATKDRRMAQRRLGEHFWDWGLTTVTSLVEVCQSTKLPVIASGGIRTGVEVAKSVALGASLASMATPLLRPATKSSSEVKKVLNLTIDALRSTMFLVGAETVEDLARVPLVLQKRKSQ